MRDGGSDDAGESRSAPDVDAVALALDDAWGSIREQATTLDSYRARVATLLGAVTIGSGLVGTVGLREGDLDVSSELAALALAAFLVQFVMSVLILYPWTFAFARKATWLRDRVVERTYGVDRLRVKLLNDAAADWSHNRKMIRRIGWAFTVCIVSFALAVVFSILSLLVGR